MSPLEPQDARVFAQHAAKLYQIKLSPKTEDKIITDSGGVPRLVKRLVKLTADKIEPEADQRLQLDLGRIAQFLAENPEAKYVIPLLNMQNSSKAFDQIGPITFSQTLTKQEYILAKLLIEKENQLVTREEMIEMVWKNKMYDVNEHALDQMLHRLRKKLETATPKSVLETFRGRGVRLTL